MKCKLISHTPSPESIIGTAARLCNSDDSIDTILDNMQDGDNAAMMVRVLDGIGHESPIEHVTFTFAIEGISRSLLAQITRHRLASFSVQSQRYVKVTDFEYVTPPEIEANPTAKSIFTNSMNAAIKAYQEIEEHLEDIYFKEMVSSGMYESKARQQAEKKAIEDARYVLPNAACTKMIVTMNARELRHFFRMRCCNRAQWEIRQLAELMLEECYRVAPALFENAGAACCSGSCPEGRMSCGNPHKRKWEIDEIKREVDEKKWKA